MYKTLLKTKKCYGNVKYTGLNPDNDGSDISGNNNENDNLGEESRGD